MTVPAPLAFPGSRTLAGWWRQLAPWQPRSWWVGHLLLHHVEALAVLVRTSHPDLLHRLVLQGLALKPTASLTDLEERLHLGRQLLGRLLHALCAEGLVETMAGGWSATEAGRQAAERGEWLRTVHERRSFYFTHPESSERTPHFLSLNEPLCYAWAADADWRFDVSWLISFPGRPEDWKQRFGFPRDVRQILPTPADDEGPPSWQRVVLDRPERLPVVVVRTEADRLLGFAMSTDGWVLHTETPVFTLERDWAEVFPGLAEGPSPESSVQAWRTWCQPRGLAGLGIETCSVQLADHRLRVAVPPRLLERLRATRSDALHGEAWVLTGSGKLRMAALLEIVEDGAKAALRQT